MTKSRASASLGGALRAESSEGVLRVIFSGEWKRDLLGPNFFTERDEALRETTLSVQVEGETYLLEENMESPMYRYDVLVGTKDMMQNPYESYKPSKEAV